MPSSPVKVKLRVAICGAGIGGLTLALALAPYPDITIDVYEATSRYEDIGAGLAIWGRGVAALRKMGLYEKLRTIAPGKEERARYELRKGDVPSGGQMLGDIIFSTTLGFRRAQFIDFIAELLSQTGRATMHFDKRCSSYTARDDGNTNPDTGGDGIAGEDCIVINFTDGTSAACDLLVGCDGIKSAVRRQLMRGDQAGDKLTPDTSNNAYPGARFSGTTAYRALVKPEELRAIAGEHPAITATKVYAGKDKHLVTYPVAGGKFINLVAYCSNPDRQVEWENGPWVVEAEHEEMLHQYRDFEPEVQALLKCAGKSSRWAMYGIEPLEFWSRGRVTILGDAAHAMPPFLGAGVGQVMEDVYILSKLLGSSSATRLTIPHILRAYEAVRRPRANQVIMLSRQARRALEFQEENANAAGEEISEVMDGLTTRLWEENGDPDDDFREAEKFVEVFVGEAGQC